MIDPSGVDATPAELGGAEDVDEKPGVARPALDHEVEIAERADETAPRLLPRPSRRDHLRNEGIEHRGHQAPGRDAGVHPDARPERRIEARDAARRRDEAGVGILGADARLDGDAPFGHPEIGQTLSARDPDLQLDEVEAGDRLRDAVLHLQARVHLEQVRVGARDQEFHRAKPDVSNLPRETHRRRREPCEQRRFESGRWGLFDQFLVAALDGTVPRAEGLHMAAHVGGDLDLDVPRAGDLALEEQASVAERRQCLGGCRAECRRQRRGVLDHADTASTAARGRLHDQRVA